MLFRRLLGLLRMGMTSARLNAHKSEEAAAIRSTPVLPQAPGRECIVIRVDADDITFLQHVVLRLKLEQC